LSINENHENHDNHDDPYTQAQVDLSHNQPLDGLLDDHAAMIDTK
jgi:hypothetical protein